MKMITRFYPILFLLIGSLLAVANPGDPDNLDQHQMNVRAEREYRAAEARLEKAYKQRLARSSDKLVRDHMIASQRAWLIYRDAAILAEFPKFDQGSGTPQFMNDFAKHLTEERISILNSEGGYW